MKCVRCSGEITDEMDKCPKCKEYTIIKMEGTVSSEPVKEQAPNGENFVYFQVQTGEKELECEVKQGFETEIPVKKGDDVKLVGFGTFTKAKRKARTGRNPQTGKAIKIPAAWAPKFRAGAEFKSMVK